MDEEQGRRVFSPPRGERGVQEKAEESSDFCGGTGSGRERPGLGLSNSGSGFRQAAERAPGGRPGPMSPAQSPRTVGLLSKRSEVRSLATRERHWRCQWGLCPHSGVGRLAHKGMGPF